MHNTEHQSTEIGPHPDEWRDGATCDECRQHTAERYLALMNGSPIVIPAIGQASTNPKMEKFWATGDPTVFAKKEGS
jgi:hypothetical protein